MNIKLNTCAFALMLISTSAVSAPVASGIGVITGYFTGWGGNAVRVQISNTNYSESGCPNQDGYMTQEVDFGPGSFKTNTAALLAASMTGKKVQVVVDGCNSAGRPKIIGVSVFP